MQQKRGGRPIFSRYDAERSFTLNLQLQLSHLYSIVLSFLRPGALAALAQA